MATSPYNTPWASGDKARVALGQATRTVGPDEFPELRGLIANISKQSYPMATPLPTATPTPAPGGGGPPASAPPAGDGGGLPPIDVKPPSMESLDFGAGGPHPGAAPEILAGPEQMRQGIGQRMAPSLAALLRYKVY